MIINIKAHEIRNQQVLRVLKTVHREKNTELPMDTLSSQILRDLERSNFIAGDIIAFEGVPIDSIEIRQSEDLKSVAEHAISHFNQQQLQLLNRYYQQGGDAGMATFAILATEQYALSKLGNNGPILPVFDYTETNYYIKHGLLHCDKLYRGIRQFFPEQQGMNVLIPGVIITRGIFIDSMLDEGGYRLCTIECSNTVLANFFLKDVGYVVPPYTITQLQTGRLRHRDELILLARFYHVQWPDGFDATTVIEAIWQQALAGAHDACDLVATYQHILTLNHASYRAQLALLWISFCECYLLRCIDDLQMHYETLLATEPDDFFAPIWLQRVNVLGATGLYLKGVLSLVELDELVQNSPRSGVYLEPIEVAHDWVTKESRLFILAKQLAPSLRHPQVLPLFDLQISKPRDEEALSCGGLAKSSMVGPLRGFFSSGIKTLRQDASKGCMAIRTALQP